MSKMAELSMDIEELLCEGMTPKFIAVTLNIPIETVYDTIEYIQNSELLSYADEIANDDAHYYGA